MITEAQFFEAAARVLAHRGGTPAHAVKQVELLVTFVEEKFPRATSKPLPKPLPNPLVVPGTLKVVPVTEKHRGSRKVRDQPTFSSEGTL